LRESGELYARLGNRVKAAAALAGHAFVLSSRGAHADALALLERVLAEFRDIGDQGGVARVLTSMAIELRLLGEHGRAREMLSEAIAWAELQGGELLSYALHTLAEVELDQRNLKDAGDLYLRALVLAREWNNPTVAYCLAGLASVAALGGEAKIAGDLWGRAERVEEETTPMLHSSREVYQHILEPFANGAAFERGYQEGRAADTASAAWPPEVWVR
jgi:tetratricopeptide (TPR) repeat protein